MWDYYWGVSVSMKKGEGYVESDIGLSVSVPGRRVRGVGSDHWTVSECHGEKGEGCGK